MAMGSTPPAIKRTFMATPEKLSMSDLTTELQTYQRLLPTLLAHQGQFAVISGEQLLIRGLSSNFSFHPSGWFQFIRHRRLPTMLMPASNTMSA
jgi:hypothetical protein